MKRAFTSNDAYAERRATIAELFDELNGENRSIE